MGKTRTTPMKAPMKTVLGLCFLLLACSSGSPGRSGGAGEESSFVSIRQTSIRGVSYKVWLQPGSSNSFVAEASGGRPGSSKGASAAVIKLFNCQRAQMKVTDGSNRRFEGRGSFCDGFREWQPLR